MTHIKNKFQYKILYYYSGDLGSKYQRFEKTFVATLVAEKRVLTKRSFEKTNCCKQNTDGQSNRKVDAHKNRQTFQRDFARNLFEPDTARNGSSEKYTLLQTRPLRFAPNVPLCCEKAKTSVVLQKQTSRLNTKSKEECIEKAEEFCKKLGYDVKGVWVSKVQDKTIYVNTKTQNKVLRKQYATVSKTA